MNLEIVSPTPAFANDIADEVRIFTGALDFYTAEEKSGKADLTIEHTEQESGDTIHTLVKISGLYDGVSAQTYRKQNDPLIEKRLHKRAIKLAVYEVMKKTSGITPPWGSLTGIRPTRIVYAEMEKGMTLPEAIASARQTFDLSEEKASLLQEIIITQQGLPPLDDNDIDIYIGIPFCVTRCAYCSFLSGELGDGSLAPPYVDALLHEISQVSRLIEQHHLNIGAVYIGGGTPTALPARQLKRVLDAACTLARGHEFTVEAGRPDTIDEEKLLLIRDAGATRISINPQTMHDETLQRIGRAHTTKQTEDAYALARKLGFSHINMDLIAGLPGEDEAMFAKTLSWAKTLHPESLTVHTLSIKRSSLLHLWQASLPGGEMTSHMVQMGRQTAHDMGMTPYYLYRQKYMAGNLENVGYALKGHACCYNVHMMEETGNVLALGAGGISKRVFPPSGKIQRAPNISNITQYIERVDEMVKRKYDLWQNE